MSRIALIFVLGFCFASSTTASAQSWPMRPVTMVVPFAAGGPMDTVGRIMAAALSDTLGQSVIVENVGGGGGMTGSARVAKAAPDGSQFVLGNVGTHGEPAVFELNVRTGHLKMRQAARSPIQAGSEVLAICTMASITIMPEIIGLLR